VYNAELKTEFIQDYTSSKITATLMTQIFDRFEKLESEYDKDLCSFNAIELQIALDNILGLRAIGRWSKLSHIRSYIKWCMNKKVPGACYNFDKVNFDGAEKIRQSTVANPIDLQRYMDEVFDAEGKHHVDNITRAYLWLAFSGLTENVAAELTKDNIDFKNMKIFYKDFICPIYPESLVSLRDAVELTSFGHDHKHYETQMDRSEGDLVLRLGKTGVNIQRLRDYVIRRYHRAKRAGKVARNISYGRIYISGIFYRTYQFEIAGIKPNFASIVADKREMKGASEQITKDSLRREIRGMEEDYQNWKFGHGYI